MTSFRLPALTHELKRGFDFFFNRRTIFRNCRQNSAHFFCGITQRLHGRNDVRVVSSTSHDPNRWGIQLLHFTTQFKDDPFSGLATNARNLHQSAVSLLAMAVLISPSSMASRICRAVRGPTPETAVIHSNTFRCSSVGTPKRSDASSRTTWTRYRSISVPTRNAS